VPGFGCGVVVFVAAALAAPGTNAFAYSVEYISGKTQRESTAITEMSQERCIGMVRHWSNGRGLRGADVDELVRKLVEASGKQCISLRRSAEAV